MGAGGTDSQRGEWVIPARHMTVGAATRTLLDLAAAGGYSTAATGPNSFRLARVYRPRWATITAIVCALLFLGLGLFLLLVKRTEVAEASVAEERDGVKVRLAGTITTKVLEALKTSVGGDGPRAVGPVPQAASFAPSHPAPTDSPWANVDVPPMFESNWSAPIVSLGESVAATQARPMRVLATPPQVELSFSTGVLVAVGHGLLIGRDPQPSPQLPAARCMPVADLSLSRTHLAVETGLRGAWVTDLHSTNGAVVSVAGRAVSCPPGQRVEAPSGAVVTLGDVSFTVRAS